jgi:hypothetical protein
MLLLLLFPTGRLLSPRWRPVAATVVIYAVLLSAASMIVAFATWSDPFGPGTVGGGAIPIVFVVAAVFIPIGLITSFISTILRYRRSTGDERLQMKWFATAAAVVAVTFSLQVWISSPAMSIVASLGLLFLWTAIAIAILKYRLYEIDVVINRAVVFGTLAVFITLVYLGLVVGVGTAVGNRRSPLLSAIAAASRWRSSPFASGPTVRQPDGVRQAGDAVRGAVGLRRTDGRHLLDRRGAAKGSTLAEGQVPFGPTCGSWSAPNPGCRFVAACGY